ncbi:DNA (cytosine-5-)-methyltransferase [Photorhabdus luminescens]|nr:DNA (cytosine-5-)-methyltransferase [Photorhabdus luminescens]
MPVYGSVCSGIEAVSMAWEPIGMSPAWFSEIENFPSSVLQYHWPHVRNLGDMTEISAMITENQADAPDILVGGTPCQAFSIAGLRNGLGDERGQLTLSFVELANVIDSVRTANNEQPSIIVWENVPGVLSSKDNAFGCFLAGLAGESEELKPTGKRWTNAGYVSGPQRNVAWRVLDAQYFGVAQRRRRVFVVASARTDICPAKILFEPGSMRWDSEPRKTARETVTGNVGNRAVIGSHRGSGLVATYRQISFCEYQTDDISSTLKSRDAKSATDLIAIALAGNTINRREKNGGGGNGYQEETSYTLTTTKVHAVNYGYVVRRLTPVECERLQGFPDNHTQIPWNGKASADCPDGHRYRVVGNSMAVPVMAWIGERILREVA